MLYPGGHSRSFHPSCTISPTQPDMSCQRFVLSAPTCTRSKTNCTCVPSFDVSLVYLRKNKRISLYIILKVHVTATQATKSLSSRHLKPFPSGPNKSRRKFANAILPPYSRFSKVFLSTGSTAERSRPTEPPIYISIYI